MPLLHYKQDDVDRLRLSIQTYGFGFLPDLVMPSALVRLRNEARELSGTAVFAKQSAKVSYQARIAPLGPEGRELLFGDQMIDLLFLVSGERVLPSEDRSCLTVYHEGDHLGPHRDHPEAECLVTAILYLAASGSSQSSEKTGLVLQVYGQEMTGDDRPRLSIPTTVGTIVIGRGSKFWHERPMLEKGEAVVALTGCYGRLDEQSR